MKTDLSKKALIRNLDERLMDAYRAYRDGETTMADYISERAYCQDMRRVLDGLGA